MAQVEAPLLDAGARYESVKRLGTGAFGAVQLARDKQTSDLVVRDALAHHAHVNPCWFIPVTKSANCQRAVEKRRGVYCS